MLCFQQQLFTLLGRTSKDCRSINSMFQFANVPWPRVLLEQRQQPAASATRCNPMRTRLCSQKKPASNVMSCPRSRSGGTCTGNTLNRWNRSTRKRLFSTSCFRSRLVAASTLTLTARRYRHRPVAGRRIAIPVAVLLAGSATVHRFRRGTVCRYRPFRTSRCDDGSPR